MLWSKCSRKLLGLFTAPLDGTGAVLDDAVDLGCALCPGAEQIVAVVAQAVIVGRRCWVQRARRDDWTATDGNRLLR